MNELVMHANVTVCYRIKFWHEFKHFVIKITESEFVVKVITLQEIINKRISKYSLLRRYLRIIKCQKK